MERIVTRTLSCGMPLIVEAMPGVRSVGLTWLLPAGTATQPADREGLTAMLLEMLHRGAGGLDSRAQADALDRVGASRSADAGAYHVRVSATMLGDRLAEALPLIVDMVRRPRFDEDSIEPARDLAMQSLESLADNPQERASIAARARHLPPPLNRSTLGTESGITSTTRHEIVAAWRDRAQARGSILALAGAVDPDTAAAQLDSLLAGWSGEVADASPAAAPSRGYAHESDQSNQVQIIVMHDAPAEPHADSILEKVAISVLSGGMSGRLFTEVREKRGLCYSVSAGYSAAKTFGSVVAYVGTGPDRAQESLDVLLAELQRLNSPAGAVTPEEFQRTMVGMKSRVVFAGESTPARAGSLAYDWHRLGRPRSLAEIASQLDAVTLEALNAYLARRRLGRLTIQTLGPNTLQPPAHA
ncbi:MAG: M16 family metallopeptidase [Phycisphaerales bacterium]